MHQNGFRDGVAAAEAMSVARHPRRGPNPPLESLSRKLLAAMILAGGLLTLASFAKYLDHGAFFSDLVRQVVRLTAG